MKGKKSKELIEEIEIPEGINVNMEGYEIVMKKDGNELRRKLNAVVYIKIDGNKIVIKTRGVKRNEKKVFGTFRAHIKNMIKGLTEGFKYKLQVASVHFPISTEINKDKNEFIVKNFLGEKKDRRIKLIPGVDIKVNKDIIEVSCADIEKAGQVAANLEKGTKVKNRDRRVFQDGIFLVSKPRKEFK